MTELTPEYSSKLANYIYLIKEPSTRRAFIRKYQDDFKVENSDSTISGKTGAFIFLKSEHTMGIAAVGINQYKGNAVVALKGTASGYDALTDLNAGIKRFHTGGSVHQGFYYTFASFLPQLQEFINKLPTDVHTIHCVGHSLGGALATLTADWLASNSGKVIKLYTFGSPRVGMEQFASGCKRRIKEDNIYRVYHRTDPVPMLPTWPFIHVPDGGIGDYQLSPPNSLNPFHHHSIDTYVSSVMPNDTGIGWSDVKNLRPKDRLDQSIESWLKSDSILSLTLNTAWIAGEAILWVLKKIGNLAGIALVISGGTTFTLLDRLAIFMHKAYQISKDISFWILRLIKRLAQLVGIEVAKDANITVAFIRMIFIRVHRVVSDLVMRAGRLVE
ncbi:Lipase (class 3) [Microbulbifer thermotolerans]|uniref:Lipase family protein n=1 Tax=Microbulbifer thermotolerans TaxID=252514 RepID=A0AB35HSX6_MICTH|nr:lipase family protein [Microbulbifer thermotolerans]MCX2795566.1 lipase family protein [Microbulbifer thermotolerans]MCX2800279.1 lipase family protein [Microbulbifer thermotolerans]WKT60869.1 lipase family protein [Microbulbifer thermotolerans]SFC35832.1 Lipase (class 3) [Microbulbifer thermotolerans]